MGPREREMAPKRPASDLPDQPERVREQARELSGELKATVYQAMTRAGAIGAQPAGAQDILQKSRRRPPTPS